ncbi:MAG: tetratricopeptide repeat protein [Verrucomicrobiae bacterium]|nr:tetratricopeptide repeat protein [Verrucomicrobiae bacterium]
MSHPQPSPSPEPVEIPLELRLAEIWGKYKIQMVAGAILVLAVAGVHQATTAANQNREAQAQALLDQAVNLQKTEGKNDGIVSVESLRKTFSEFPGTLAGGQALLLYADSLFQAGNFNESATAYTRFTTEYPKHPLLYAGYYGAASCREAAGALDEAVSLYQNIRTKGPKNDLWRGYAMISLARCLEIKNDPAGARQVYDEILTNPLPDSLKRMAQERRVRLG